MQNLGTGLSATPITKARLTALVTASTLVQGASYWITDERTYVVAIATNQYVYVRQQARANVTLYVATTGSDANDGLTVGTPFLTLQKAWNVLSTMDLGVFTGTIQVANGTYTTGILAASAPVGGTGITILGNAATPTSVVVSTAADGFYFSCNASCAITIKGFSIGTSGASKAGVRVDGHATIIATYISCAGMSGGGSAGFYHAEGAGAKIFVSTWQSIMGNIPCYVCATGGAITFYAITVAIAAGVAVSWGFAVSTYVGGILISGVTFSGTATGPRYRVAMNSFILTSSSDPAYLPGSVVGIAATGGQYA